MPLSRTLLTVDIGNTTIALGFFRGAKLLRSGKIPTLTAAKNSDTYYRALTKIAGKSNLSGLAGIAVSSVVPKVNPVFRKIGLNCFGIRPFFITYKNCGIKIRYRKPSQVGADRLANAAAGKTLYGAPLIVVDFGTAITFDCIDKSGSYAGGIILPGAELTARALYEHTAKLPLVNPFKKPSGIIGRNTAGAIASGLFYGLEGAVDRILFGLKRDMQCDRIVLTGGYAGSMHGRIARRAALDPDLTLKGVRIIWENNRLRRERRRGRK